MIHLKEKGKGYNKQGKKGEKEWRGDPATGRALISSSNASLAYPRLTLLSNLAWSLAMAVSAWHCPKYRL
jgi:hypothetical protein